MQVVRGTRHLEAPLAPVLTIGNFDGVHLGHRALIRDTVALARELGARAAALTFHPSPQEVLRPGSATPRLQSLAQRLHALGTTGLDVVVVEPFDEQLGALTPPEFATTYLLERIGIRGLVLGHDFRFGRGRTGTVDFLREHLPVPVRRVDAVLHDGEPVSSSRIRAALSDGSVGVATGLLGRPHEVEGTVVSGDGRGRELGFPTANLSAVQGLLPANGVYAVRVRIGPAEHAAVANIGTRPTFGTSGRTVEIHLLDVHTDLYDRRLTVRFESRLRDEQRFASVDALTSAIQSDVARARTILA